MVDRTVMASDKAAELLAILCNQGSIAFAAEE
jgi:hypothetical protein